MEEGSYTVRQELQLRREWSRNPDGRTGKGGKLNFCQVLCSMSSPVVHRIHKSLVHPVNTSGSKLSALRQESSPWDSIVGASSSVLHAQ